MIYAVLNEDNNLIYSSSILEITTELGYKVELTSSRTIVINKVPCITIGNSYKNEEVLQQLELYLIHFLKRVGYTVYKLIEI